MAPRGRLEVDQRTDFLTLFQGSRDTWLDGVNVEHAADWPQLAAKRSTSLGEVEVSKGGKVVRGQVRASKSSGTSYLMHLGSGLQGLRGIPDPVQLRRPPRSARAINPNHCRRM